MEPTCKRKEKGGDGITKKERGVSRLLSGNKKDHRVIQDLVILIPRAW